MTTAERGGTATGAAAPRERGLATRPLMAYRTIDLLVPVAIGVAFGVAFIGYGALDTVLTPVFAVFPPLVGLMAGLWSLPAMLAGLIVRRPGAALLAEVLAASLEALLGGKWALGTLVSGVLQGGGVEIALLVFAFCRFTLPVAMLGGVLATGLEWIYERFVYYPEFSTFFGFMLLVFFVLSGIVLCGALGWVLTRALAATGALDALPAGRDRTEEQRI